MDEAEATADLLGEAALGRVFEDLGVVVGDVTLETEEEAENAVLSDS